MKILLGSPIRQRPEILAAFLESLLTLDLKGIHLDYCFVDDNDDPRSTAMLGAFRPEGRVYQSRGDGPPTEYLRDTVTHHWKEDLIWKVARYKDAIIEFAVQQGYDALFLIDSDLVLHPMTLRQLVRGKRDIISEIFWTRWGPEEPELPQVWLSDQYTLHEFRRGEQLTAETVNQRRQEFLARLRQPGVYPVGGLGACTLISRAALLAGVRFREIPNISLWGEDRHFCIRAMALGFPLYVDTHLPAYHIYRERDLHGVAAYKAAFAGRTAELEVADVVRNGLEQWGTSDYRTAHGLEGIQFFAPELREKRFLEQGEVVRRAQEAQAVARTTTNAVQVKQLDLQQGRAQVSVQLLNEGEHRGGRIRDEFVAEVAVVRQNGEWAIANVEFTRLPDQAASAQTAAAALGNTGAPSAGDRPMDLASAPTVAGRKGRGDKNAGKRARTSHRKR